MSQEAMSLISGLCTVNPSQRLGNISGGASRVRNHPWFRSINWDDMYHRRTPGPFIPKVSHAADASNFDDYDPAPESDSIYTDELAEKYEDEFKDF